MLFRSGRASKTPLAESFGQWRNLLVVLIALFGATAGQAVVWYAGQFYTQFFLTQTLKIDGATANLLVAASLAPFWFGCGWIYLAGALLGGLHYLKHNLRLLARPDRRTAMACFHASLVQLSLVLLGALLDGAIA